MNQIHLTEKRCNPINPAKQNKTDKNKYSQTQTLVKTVRKCE